MLSVRHEFPDAWARFVGAKPAAGDRFALTVGLAAELYPFWSTGFLRSVRAVNVIARVPNSAPANQHDRIYGTAAKADAAAIATMTRSAELGNLLRASLPAARLPARPDTGVIDLFFDGNLFDDVWIAIT